MMDEVRQQLIEAFRGLLEGAIAMTPRLLIGLVLVVVAIAVAKLVEVVLRTVLTRLRLDDALKQTGLDQALSRVGLRQSLNEFLPRVAYYLLLFLFARTASDALGLVAISQALASFLAYLPNLVAAVLILLLGSAAAQFAGRAVQTAAANSGIDFASSLGTLVNGLIMFVIGIMAVGQLQIDTEIVRLVTTGALAAFAIAFGLSFGLGSRDITRNILAGFYARKIFEVGREIELAGERGVLASITPTQTVLDQAGRRVSVGNAAFLDQVVKQ